MRRRSRTREFFRLIFAFNQQLTNRVTDRDRDRHLGMGLYRLVVLSLLMLLSTLLASFAPLHFNFSQSALDRVSTYSTGLLVGAALTVVIPEGVAAVFESIEHSQEGQHEHGGSSSGWIGASLLAGFILMYALTLCYQLVNEEIERIQKYLFRIAGI